MEGYSNKGIKDIIDEFPQIENILEEYGIGCGPCTVGICQLKDILDIHKMEREKEKELMTRIEAVIYPERGIKIALKSAGVIVGEKPQDYSSSIKRLVDEHSIIKRWLTLIPVVVKNLDLSVTQGVQSIEDGIDLIRNYADRLHHAKEENILFTYFDTSAEVFQVIFKDHRQARNHVKEMVKALDAKDEVSLADHLTAYGKLLAEHIKKEDEILFPWLDRRLTPAQQVELLQKFNKEDKRLGIDQQKYLTFLSRLEKKYGLTG